MEKYIIHIQHMQGVFENFIGAYHLLDIVPKGRDEDDLSYGMEWVRHRDRYDDKNFIDPYTTKDK